MAVDLNPVAPTAAIAAYEARRGKLTETFSWQDLFEGEHATQFTVAKSAGFDILADIDAAMVKAITEGGTLQGFSKQLKPVLEAKGWWGKKIVDDPLTGDKVVAQLGSPKRLEKIFNINMRVSYAAGHWASFERNKEARPFLRYVCLLDDRTRPAHRARHNLVLPVDHPYWNVWAPPCGWNCRCTLQSLSRRDIDRLQAQGEKLSFEPPAETYRSFTNRRTGEIIRVPDGIDPGWAYNPGKAGYRAQALASAERLATAPVDLAAAAAQAPDWIMRPLGRQFRDWFDQAAEGGRVESSTVVAGALSPITIAALRQRGIDPESAAITVTQETVRHMLRDTKAVRGAGASMEMLRDMPDLLRTARAVLLDRRNGAILYVFDAEDRIGKIVVKVGYRSKVRRPGQKPEPIVTNAIRTAGVVDVSMLTDINFYEVLEGNL